MKRKLNFLNVNLAKGIFVATLLVMSSCTQDEALEKTDEDISISNLEDGINNDELSAKKKNAKDLGQSCDNPRQSGNTYYRVYESTDVGAGTDLVSKTTTSGSSVDVIKFLDDRTCSHNYSQSNGYGVYKLTAGTNPFDARQPRIERQYKTISRGSNRFITIEGYVNIGRVGDGDAVKRTSLQTINNQKRVGEPSGTYIIQAKGDHDNKAEGAPADPAILLLLAKPANSVRVNGRVQRRFNLYAEQVTKPGGTKDRKVVFLRTVNANSDVFIKMTNRFDSSGNNQYVDIQIGKNPTLKNYSFKVPNDGGNKKGKNAKIRFGAYRCKSGSATIKWRNVRHNFRL